uniref:Uncharacterized protein n=1 Tax=Rhizophora mucronata TaxID=61149 RepID=A0A2P2P787_RHIMU
MGKKSPGNYGTDLETIN